MINTDYSSLVNRGSNSIYLTATVSNVTSEKEVSTQNSKPSTFDDTAVILTLSKQTDGVNLKSMGASTYATTPTLKIGSSGNAVYELQRNLTILGYSTNGTDGIFGNDTKNAVISFQKAYGLTADGIVGAETQLYITRAMDYHNRGILTVGSRGARVTELQKNLTKLGYNTKGTDGIFGTGTQNAVIAFQRDHGLKQDGMVGIDTWGVIAKEVSKITSSEPVKDTNYESIKNGKVMLLPKPGEQIEVSLGIDKPSQKAKVSNYNAWSVQFSIEGCRKNYPNEKCTERLNYVLDNFSYNKEELGLLELSINGKKCYAGAMVEGFGEIGDVAEITLDDGTKFNFLILDVKSTQHDSKTLLENSGTSTPQCQNQYGHGYMLGDGVVQLSVCEFYASVRKNEGSAIQFENGEFLKSRYVAKAQIIGHVEIDKNL